MIVDKYIIILVLIVCGFFVWFFSNRAQHKERMLKIELGIPDSEINKQNQAGLGWLRFACILTGLSIGLLIISTLVWLRLLDKGGNVLPIAILGTCTGISLVVAHLISNKKSN